MNSTEYLTAPEAADYLRISASNLAKRRMAGGDSPPFAKFGKTVRYRKADLDAWAAAQLRRSTSDPGQSQAA